MILDVKRFVADERPYWDELETVLNRLENDPSPNLSLKQVQRFHYLYQRSMGDLAKVATFAAAPDLHLYLEALVARAYGEAHDTRRSHAHFLPWRWFFFTFPQTFRRHLGAFWLSLAVTLAGCAFGVMALAIDADAKRVILPQELAERTPQERVREEERRGGDRLTGVKSRFSAQLMTHNTQVAFTTMALGMTWGAGTGVLLFYNGVILGAVSLDYIQAGQGKFLTAWLLPHGSIEIPAILVGGQAGFLLAGALIGWGSRTSRRRRLREIAPDLVTLALGAACMLVWAGVVEAFLSQYHQPVIPYDLKIGLGMVELILLFLFLARAGAKNA